MKNNLKRRQFIKSATAAGVSVGLSAGAAHARKPAILKRTLKRDFIKVGMVGLGPYSHAMAYTTAINEPSVPPRTNMKVVAVWGKKDGYLSSLRGSEKWKKSRVEGLGAGRRCSPGPKIRVQRDRLRRERSHEPATQGRRNGGHRRVWRNHAP